MSTTAQGEGAGCAGLGGGAHAVTEPVELGAGASKLNARAAVRCSAWLGDGDSLIVAGVSSFLEQSFRLYQAIEDHATPEQQTAYRVLAQCLKVCPDVAEHLQGLSRATTGKAVLLPRGNPPQEPACPERRSTPKGAVQMSELPSSVRDALLSDSGLRWFLSGLIAAGKNAPPSAEPPLSCP